MVLFTPLSRLSLVVNHLGKCLIKVTCSLLEFSIFFLTNICDFLKLCDLMWFEAKRAKSHHRIISEALICSPNGVLSETLVLSNKWYCIFRCLISFGPNGFKSQTSLLFKLSVNGTRSLINAISFQKPFQP